MKKLEIEVVAKQYTIEVDLLSIMNYDRKKEDNNQWDDVLSEQLSNIKGIDNVDYNGHFGNFIWVTIETEFDTDETWNKIEKFINNAMKG